MNKDTWFLDGSISEDWGLIDFYILSLKTVISNEVTYTYVVHDGDGSLSKSHKRDWEVFKTKFKEQLDFFCDNMEKFSKINSSKFLQQEKEMKLFKKSLIKRLKLNLTYLMVQYFLIKKQYLQIINPLIWSFLKKECISYKVKKTFVESKVFCKTSFIKFMYISFKFFYSKKTRTKISKIE